MTSKLEQPTTLQGTSLHRGRVPARGLRRCLKSALFGSILGLALSATMAKNSAHAVSISKEARVQDSALIVGPEYFRISSGNATIANWGVLVGAEHALSEDYAMRFVMRQVYSAKEGLAAIYSGLSIEAAYTLLGSLNNRITVVNVDGSLLSHSRIRQENALQVTLSINQYFFNVDAQAIPYAGFGLAMNYWLIVAEGKRLGVGTAMDYMRSRDKTLRPLHFMFPLNIAL